MGDIGKYKDEKSYPDLELSKAIRIAEQIRKDFGGRISASNLARIFGIEPRGGGFANRVKDVMAYGLIEGKGEYRLTKLAERIIQNPADNEAKAQAFLNVPLFKAMHNEFKMEIPESNAFVLRMKELTGEGDDRAVSIRAGRLRNHYNEALRYLYPETYHFEEIQLNMNAPGETNITVPSGLGQPPVGDSYLYLVDTKRNLRLGIDDNIDNLRIAITHLKNVEKSLTQTTKQHKAEKKAVNESQ